MLNEPELICCPVLATGTHVMLSDQADTEAVFAIGTEAVLQVLFQDGIVCDTNADGDLIVHRHYCLRHLHADRLIFNLPEEFLQVVEAREASGQVLLHREMVKRAVDELGIRVTGEEV